MFKFVEMNGHSQSGITDLSKHEVAAFINPKVWTSHIHVTFKLYSLPGWVLYSVLFCPDIVMKTKSQVIQRHTPDRHPVGSFPWGLWQMDCLSLPLSFILAVSISRSHTLTSLGILLPSLCAQGSIGVVSPLPWGAWNEIGCSTWPPLHHLYARLLLTFWTILYIWEIYAQSNSRLVLLRQQNRSFFSFFLSSFVPCIRGMSCYSFLFDKANYFTTLKVICLPLWFIVWGFADLLHIVCAGISATSEDIPNKIEDLRSECSSDFGGKDSVTSPDGEDSAHGTNTHSSDWLGTYILCFVQNFKIGAFIFFQWMPTLCC